MTTVTDPYEHDPRVDPWKRGMRDRLDGVGCRETDGRYLEGWYEPDDHTSREGVTRGVLMLDGTVTRTITHPRRHRWCGLCVVHPYGGWHERDVDDPDRELDAAYQIGAMGEDAWGTS